MSCELIAYNDQKCFISMEREDGSGYRTAIDCVALPLT